MKHPHIWRMSAFIALAVLSLVIPSCLLGGTEPIGNSTTTCAAGDTCSAGGIGNSDISCPNGNCHFICTGITNCNFDCAGGGCSMDCQNTGNCIMSCPSNDCTSSCAGTGNCIIND